MSTIPTTWRKVIASAKSQLGVKESPFGSNRTKYGRAINQDGVPWCAIFVWWVFMDAGFDLRKIAPTPELAYTPTFSGQLKAAGWRSVSVSTAHPGDIVFFDFPDDVRRIQHVGIVERVGSQLTCIEGNTSIRGSQSNGGMVCRKVRSANVVKAIYRPPYEEDDVTPKEVKQAVLEVLADGDTVENRSWRKGDPEANKNLSVLTVLSQVEDDLDTVKAEVEGIRDVKISVARLEQAFARLTQCVADLTNEVKKGAGR